MLLQLRCDGLQRLNAKRVEELLDFESLVAFDSFGPSFNHFYLNFCIDIATKLQLVSGCNHISHFQNPCLLLLPDLKLGHARAMLLFLSYF